MSLYVFPPGEDPGPSFSGLLRLVQPAAAPLERSGSGGLEIRHATTIVALRYGAGVVMAGDRRATEGVSIAHRSIEKVFAADRYSAVVRPAFPALRAGRLPWRVAIRFNRARISASSATAGSKLSPRHSIISAWLGCAGLAIASR